MKKNLKLLNHKEGIVKEFENYFELARYVEKQIDIGLD